MKEDSQWSSQMHKRQAVVFFSIYEKCQTCKGRKYSEHLFSVTHLLFNLMFLYFCGSFNSFWNKTGYK